VSLTEQVAGNGPGSPPPGEPEPGSARRRGRFRWWWLLPPAALAVPAVVILTVLAATYQPVASGDFYGLSLVPGLPHAKGVRWVNTFGAASGDLFVPPQQGPFTLSASITNTGTHAVTIEGVSLRRPGEPSWPVTQTGPARYYLVKGGAQQPTVRILKNVTLRPGDMMIVGILVRAAAPCAEMNDWTSVDSFLVRERFLSFTHTVPVPFIPEGARVIMRSPGGHPGEPNVLCASQ
jgi:hypothetical protein